ncbi:D-alanyl-D-alanine carboxypeptidase (penicillin-binding protein 5/6) [Sinosporangium album]|uniref:D-alanyl-D-alanine carboxypeptidase (Penicillin-binding protein 5/6) n=1 Tax=Sinosporangium album TaxID=504805 RepID=A0A1G8C105_9ACTN|nr:D-alanyl-D-alanine carboxypeptidase family protein [Sinosporangium album]SDH39142.1 D-alanyl-D-alanine carboxypeptidase (penicillin-binding protein 5/6) [Sinosporangium album]
MHIGRIPAILCSAVLTIATGLTGAALSVPAHAASPPESGVGATSVTEAQTTPRTVVTLEAVPPAVSARSAILVDAETGAVHFDKSADRRQPVASLTKIMTAYVVLGEAALDDRVRITSGDVRHPKANNATGAGFRKGERPTVRDLLHGLMLSSGADASRALARAYGPGEAAFVAKMNTAARALGLRDTRYVNSDGLPTPAGGGHSTARDQAKLAMAAQGEPALVKIGSAKRYIVRKTAHTERRVLVNTNKLLSTLPGAYGLKTGYHVPAGWCVAFAVQRDGNRYIGVVLGDTGAERRFRTATRLIDWAENR